MKRFMSHFIFRKAAIVSVGVLMLTTATGCATSLTKGGLGGATVTRVDASELPGPQGQLGLDQRYVYRIGPHDKLRVDVLGLDEFVNRPVTVDGNGEIVLPIAGVVDLDGLTIGEASDKLALQLRAGYVRNPRVAVNVEESVSRFVTLDGEVEQPGNYPIVANMTLMRGVAAAKGATDFAKLREVVIHRSVNGRKMIALYDLQAIRRGAYPDPVLYPNDVVVVGDSQSRRLLERLVNIAPLFVSPLIAVLDSRN